MISQQTLETTIRFPLRNRMVRRIHILPGVGETTRYDHILTHYCDGDWAVATRRGIVPELPRQTA